MIYSSSHITFFKVVEIITEPKIFFQLFIYTSAALLYSSSYKTKLKVHTLDLGKCLRVTIIMIHHDQNELGEERVISLMVPNNFTIKSSEGRNQIRAGTWRQEQMQAP